MNAVQIVRAAMPGASVEMCDFVIWERTPYPCAAVTPKSLFKAAARWRRASAAGRWLCSFCDNEIDAQQKWTCDTCRKAVQPNAMLSGKTAAHDAAKKDE